MGPPPHSPDGGRGRPVQSREIRVPPAGPRGERVSVAAVRLCAPVTRLVLPGRPVVNAARRGISRNSRVAGGPPAREDQPQGCRSIRGSAAGWFLSWTGATNVLSRGRHETVGADRPGLPGHRRGAVREPPTWGRR